MNFANDMAPEPTTFSLHRRARSKDELVISIAPDAVCGYISERPGAQRACPADDHCYFMKLPLTGQIACCDNLTCHYNANCINSKEYFQSSKCSDGCEVDTFTLKCTNSSAPYCNTVAWEGNITDYWCNDIDITTVQSAALTYKGQVDLPEFSTLNQEDLSSLESQMSKAKTAGTAYGVPEQTSEQTSGSTAIETSADDGGSSETPVAAIVGGTVSGVAVLAATGLGLFFFLRRSKKKKQSKAASAPGYQQSPENKSPWSPGQQSGAPYYYDPTNPQSNISPDSQYVYPQAAGFSPQQNVVHEAGGEAVDPSSQPQELPAKKEPAELA
ncbi:hypothetical protein FPOAC2_02768 [Fusarium poae]|uniref:Uncharacterized protein n=1 Tax=Fusarium poae TaxID=36050 RepID=A0A1B8B790_FUSPO|nr:hypothetical protein FPOAC1_002672 [Fusarium poae]KAG8676665.1 hypothetical protein FPOAC1_002672 [Fusarium poae]OBS28603.1 hypothetical protein FPOA_02540 [Fusarium poae]